MSKVDIKVVVKEGVNLPVYKTSGSAGCDVCAYLTEDVVLKKGMRKLIPTGIFMEIPSGYEVQIRPRSGLAIKNGITVLNSPGTIDSDYRGEICIILVNLGNEDFVIHNGDRIAQAVIAPVVQCNFIKTDKINETERASGGFGSTGVKS